MLSGHRDFGLVIVTGTPQTNLRHRKDPRAQRTKLQGITQLAERLAVGYFAAQVRDVALKVHVRQQMVQSTVASHVLEVLAQRFAPLARDLVRVLQEIVEAVETVDPLGCSLRADTGYAREVVGSFSDQCGDFRVSVRRDPVFCFNALRGHLTQVTRAHSRVENGHAIGDSLETIAIPRGNIDAHIRICPAFRKSGKNIVCLEAFP